MAKKKSKEDQSTVGSVEARLAKEFGDGILVLGSHIAERKRITIPVSPAMDMLLGGGIPEGSFVIPTGPPKVGKTSMSLDYAGTALEYPCDLCEQREAYFFNIEGRLQSRDLLGIHHLIPHINKTFHVIESKPGRILTGENYIDIGEKLINEKPGCIFIFDSFSQLCTKARRDANIGDRFRDDTPLLLANFCKRICNVIPVNKSIVIGVTHLISNQGQGMSMWSEASGRKVQYQVDVKIKATHATAWTASSAENSPQIGQDVHWKCSASPIGPPGTECTSKLRYGWGLDKQAELANIAVDLNIIKKGGSWYTIGDDKVQGFENLRNYLIEHDDAFRGIYKDVREMLGYESS